MNTFKTNNNINKSGFAFFPVLVLFLLVAGLVIGVTAVRQRTSTNSKAFGAGDCASHGGFSGYGDDCDCGINGGTKVRVVECEDGTVLPAEQLGGSCSNECTGDQKTNPSATPQPAGGTCGNNGGLAGYGDDCDCSVNQPAGGKVRVAECSDGKIIPLERIGSCEAGTCKDGQKVNPSATPLPASGNCSSHGGTTGFGTDCDCSRNVGGSNTSGEKVNVEVCNDDTKFTLEPTGEACGISECSNGGIQAGADCQVNGDRVFLGCLCITKQVPNCETAGSYYECSNNKWEMNISYDNASCSTDACQGLVQCTNIKPPTGGDQADTQAVGLIIDHFGEVGANVKGDLNKDGKVDIVDVGTVVNSR